MPRAATADITIIFRSLSTQPRSESWVIQSMTQHIEVQSAHLNAEVRTLELLLAEREARLTEKDILIAELRSALHYERRSSKGWKPMLIAIGLNIAASVLLSVYSLTFQYEMMQSPFLLGTATACIVLGIISLFVLFFPARGIVKEWIEARQTSSLVRYVHQDYLSICALFCSAFFVHTSTVALMIFCFGILGIAYNTTLAFQTIRKRLIRRITIKRTLALLRKDYRKVKTRTSKLRIT